MTVTHYTWRCRWGLLALAVLAAIRFVMKPWLGIPYPQGTHLVSLTVALPVLMVLYSVAAARRGAGSREILGIALTLSFSAAVLIILAIGIDEWLGVDTYFTDPVHGGNAVVWAHMLGHAVAALVFGLLLWGLGWVTCWGFRRVSRG